MASPLSTRSTPNIPPSSAVSHISSSTVVNAPIEHVWNVLLDTSTWPAWNTFCPRVTIRAQPSQDSSPQDQQPVSTFLRNGTQMTFHVHMNRDSAKETATQLVVTEFEPPSSATGTTDEASTTTTTPPTSSTRLARITWVVDQSVKRALPLFLLNAERVHELVEIEVDAAEGPGSDTTTTSPTTATTTTTTTITTTTAATAATAGHSAGVARRRCTEVRTWEAQTGWLAYVVRWLYGARLTEAFRDWVEDLKRFVEEEEKKRPSQ